MPYTNPQIGTHLKEGIDYPVPVVVPDDTNKATSYDLGVVRFLFNRLDLDTYAEANGRLNVNSALGITEEHLLDSARKHVAEQYESHDIKLGDPMYVAGYAANRAIEIRYKVTL